MAGLGQEPDRKEPPRDGRPRPGPSSRSAQMGRLSDTWHGGRQRPDLRRTVSHGAMLSNHGREPEVGEYGPCLVEHAGSLWSALDLVRAYNVPIFLGPCESDLVGTCLVRALGVLRFVPEAAGRMSRPVWILSDGPEGDELGGAPPCWQL